MKLVIIGGTGPPSFEEAAVMHFFTSSTRNLLEAAAAAGVAHYLALSAVGTERIPAVRTCEPRTPRRR